MSDKASTDETGEDDGISVPDVSLPRGGGAIRGLGENFQTDAFSGTGSLSVPIPATAARGFEPKLNLSYNSGAGNGDFGIGFSLSLPRIYRKTNTGIPKYDGTDIFILSEEGQLTPRLKQEKGVWLPDVAIRNSGGRQWKVLVYRPRREKTFALIEHWTDPEGGGSFWQVTNAENVVAVFGKSAPARVADPRDESRIFEWLLEETRDAKGNKQLYTYKEENTDGLPEVVYEVDRSYRAKKYIQSIQYGNYFEKAGEKFAFELIFDYGEYDLKNLDKPKSDPYTPVRTWPARLDPFSSFKSGFEIRTCRLCRNILLFHRFKELGANACLVNALRLGHAETRSLSFLESVTHTGYRRKADGSYGEKSLPALDLNYSQFHPTATPEFKRLNVDGRETVPGYLNARGFQLLDLNGEGIPGLLYSDTTTSLYYEPRGNGCFQAPDALPSFPVSRNFQNPAVSMVDLNGNGQKDLVLGSPPVAGYFARRSDGSWSPFQSFQAIPEDLANPLSQQADLSGNGKIDRFVLERTDVLLYQSKGTEGYEAPRRIPLAADFPTAVDTGEVELVSFADVFGDGLSHRIRIRDGQVEAWPDLGYGRFGEKVTLGNAPRFDPDTRVSRIYTADVDGSGTADLVFAYSDRVEVYLNQSGNSFAGPISVTLPESFSDIDRIAFADILGTGTSTLIFTKMGPEVRHWYFNFGGEREAEVQGRKRFDHALKPYLLTKINNNLGTLTEIYYASSTKFYLADKNAGIDPVLRLPFPVQVVEKKVTTDEISGSRLTSTHAYHDGYYDPVEREFRGFGFVESRDSETFAEFEKSAAQADFPAERLNKELFVPPVYTRTWFHTGVFREAGVVRNRFKKDYYRGDKEAYDFPDSVLDPAIGSDTLRQAYVALKGSVMRREVYGLDGGPRQAHPYTVTESNFAVKLEQDLHGQKYAAFQVNPRENISYTYERNPLDPRVQQTFTLEIDPLCGKTTKECTVFLPRRSGQNRAWKVYPEQERLKATAKFEKFINTSNQEPFRYRGVSCETREFEIFALDLQGERYFAYDDLLPVKTAVENPVPYAGTLTTGKLQARQLTWQRNFYWNDKQTAALGAGQISARALLHHRETAVFTNDFLSATFGARLTDATLESNGGYFFDRQNKYWWNRGTVQNFFDRPHSFYRLNSTENSFVASSSPLYSKSTVEYDPYYFAPVKRSRYLDVTKNVANVVQAQIDYITLRPYQITDINDNVAQAVFDPLGKVVVTSLFGTENGKPFGGMRLYPYDGKPAEYRMRDDATLSTVLGNSANYLQGASHFFFYDLSAWKNDKQPAGSVDLTRDDFYYGARGASAFACKTSIQYSDGFGRIVEEKVLTEPGASVVHDAGGNLKHDSSGGASTARVKERWIVSGRTVYNNKGKPCERYLSYFSDTPAYEDQADIVNAKVVPPPEVIHYDPLSRIYRVDSPKGFFSRVEFDAWTEKHYDQNDTIKKSPYYVEFEKNYPAKPTQEQADEKDALNKAAKFYNTPSITMIDNTGLKIREIVDNLGNVSPDTFKPVVKGSSVKPKDLFDALVAAGYLQTDDFGTWVTETFQPYEKNFVLNPGGPYKRFSAKITDVLKQSCLTSFMDYDIQGRPLKSIDPRLYYSNQNVGTDYFNFEYGYTMENKSPVYVNSVDAGVQKKLHDIYGNPFWSLSARNYCQLITCDALQRRSTVRVKKIPVDQPIPTYDDFRLVEAYTYGESVTGGETNNLRGQIHEIQDLSGIVKNTGFNIQGELLESSRQMTKDYKNNLDWNSTPPPVLENDIYSSKSTYNALKQPTGRITPDGTTTTYSYNRAGQLSQVSVTYKNSTSPQSIVNGIEYDARGRREKIEYANGIVTGYTYEATTLRLIRLLSTRSRKRSPETIQNITHAYDPAGNVTRSRNNTFKAVFGGNQKVEPLADYTYDALYRLVRGNGRQHPGINADTYKNNAKDGDFKQSRFSQLPNVNDSAKLENYSIFFDYDDSGNLIKKRHSAKSASWAREVPVKNNSNRLEDIPCDAAGNMLQLDINSPVKLVFNCCENLVQAGVIERPGESDDADFYVYDGDERRTRKVSERMQTGGTVNRIEEKIYLSNYEIKRIKKVDSQGKETAILERNTLRIMDDKTCVAMMHFWVQDDAAGGAGKTGQRQLRFQMDDHLGSVASEYDPGARLISYEEYFPYGGTAIIAGPGRAEVKLKDYRYSGQERDDSTGLYYYGARYYVPWLGRWSKPDPAGTVDGPNLYAFVSGNPVTHKDVGGMAMAANKYEWDVVHTGAFVSSDADLQSVLTHFGKPTQSVVQTYTDLADRVGFDMKSGVLTQGTVSDLHEMFDATKPLHLQFNDLLGEQWRESMENYTGAKRKIPLYSVMRSKATVFFKTVDVDTPTLSTNLNDHLKAVTGRWAEIHHILNKAVYPDTANQTPVLMLAGRSESEKIFGPGQHELMHMVSSGNDPDKFNVIHSQFRDEYVKWYHGPLKVSSIE